MTISIRLSEEINAKLDQLVILTKRPKSFFMKEAIENYIEDMEDVYISLERIANPKAKYFSSEQLTSNLDNEA